ncbi:hypothetical protein Tco_0786081, partial [Tanacetum coccineum]
VHNFVSVMEVEPDIENITLEEYLKYESKKGRRFWKSVLSKGSPIRYEGADFNSFYHDKSDALEYWDSDMEIIDDVYYKLPPLEPCFQTSHPYNKSGFVSPNENDEIDIDRLDGVPDNLFKIGAENLRKMKQEKVQVVECDEGKLEEIWDITVEDVESLRKLITPIPFISQTIYTTPPDDAYVVSDTKPILDELLEEFRDKLLKIAVFDEEADCNPVKDIKELLCIMKTNVELESFIQQLNPLHGEIQSSKLSTKTGFYAWVVLSSFLKVSIAGKDERMPDKSSRHIIKLKILGNDFSTCMIDQVFQVGTWMLLDEEILENVLGHAIVHTEQIQGSHPVLFLTILF